jgi:galactose oxidase
MRLNNLSILLAVGLVWAEIQGSPTSAVAFDPQPNDPSSFSQSPPLGQRIKRRKWEVECDSSTYDHPCDNIIDEDVSIYWLSQDSIEHLVVVDLGESRRVNAIEVRPASEDGLIQEHKVYVSTDKNIWGSPVAFGTWNADNSIKYSIFNPRKAQFVRLVSESPEASISDLNIWEYTLQTDDEFVGGTWGPTDNRGFWNTRFDEVNNTFRD